MPSCISTEPVPIVTSGSVVIGATKQLLAPVLGDRCSLRVKPLVVIVAAYPKPCDCIIFQKSKGAIASSNPH